ncbi:MAG TPA: fibronectin type III domain-containing protein, partial [Ohtaekwangia sp.]|uniref:fibronectin type III domain-containing protein n=1 Tax=Ohtaekwangia sp. TaxID=2066019 RepID=UPI002F93AAC8
MIRSLLFFLAFLCTLTTTQTVSAQSFPVNITTSISSPYTPYLADYTEPASQKLMVNILLRDHTVPEYSCKFRLTIEGVGITIRTKSYFMPPPTQIQGGVPTILYGEDLAEYFNPANLDFSGISKGDYTRGAKLPEGVYRFTLEVLDYNRGTVVSNKGTATAWIILNDPPLLNQPRADAKLKIVDPTNIPFTWTPRHTGSPNAAFTTEYIFKLVEVWPATRNPYDAFLSQQPLYETTTSFTQIVYGPSEPALIPGRKYAWQVQAKDIEGKDLFKNEGRSEVYVFQFGDAIGVPQNFRRDDGSNTSVLLLRWEPAPDGAIPEQYRVRYRQKGDTRGVWYESVTPQRWVAVPDLQRDTEYEMQVRAEATLQYSEYSQLVAFKTDANDKDGFECG